MSNGQELENENSAVRALMTLRYATDERGGCSDCAGTREETVVLLTELMHLCQGEAVDFRDVVKDAAVRYADDVGTSLASEADLQEAEFMAADVKTEVMTHPTSDNITNNTPQIGRPKESPMSDQSIQMKPEVATTLTMPGGGRLVVTLTRDGVIAVRGFDAENDGERHEWAQELKAPARTFAVELEVRGKITLNVRARDEAQLERWMAASNVVDEAMRWGDFTAHDDIDDHDYVRVSDSDGVDLDLTE